MFHLYHTLDGPMYARESENPKSNIFEIPPKIMFIAHLLLMIRNMQ